MTNERLIKSQQEAVATAESYKGQADVKVGNSTAEQLLTALWMNTVFLIEVARRLPPPMDDTE